LVTSLLRIRTLQGIKQSPTYILGDPKGIPGTERPMALG
tara:strand:- start:190 stop:306 length:117 start_codon:yes stop_codon:yes gene_type:complete